MSIWLSTVITGRREARRRSAMKRSPPPIGSEAFSTKSAASQSERLLSTVACIRAVSPSAGRWNPGRSSSTACQPSPCATAVMRRRVVWGRGETAATWLPARALASVDLPTFGRPARATSPER